MKYYFGVVLFLILTTFTSAQFYEFGQDPASIKWKRLDTEHFKIIFPSDFAENSQKLAVLMEGNYKANSQQLNHQPSKIPLIIHNQTAYSNAFVTWAPKRMEFFTFPDPESYPIDWLNELSLHEFRHVIQIDKLNQSFTHYLSLLLGQQANGVVAGLMPLWFIEGDAVSAETSLSQSGRGRLPSFEMEIKAKLLSDTKLYSLNKAYLGSYKDFVPDHYRLGYQMVSYARKTYGDDYWTNALDYIARRPYLISPLYFYSKKMTGGGQSLLYRNTMKSLKNHWRDSEFIRKPEIQAPFNNRNSNIYTSYSHPCLLEDSSLIAVKTGMNIIPRFVKIQPGGAEKNIFIPGTMVSGRFSIHNDKILWDEYLPDMRWTNRSYSVLKEYNIKSGKCKSITRKSRYISPVWSASGDSIAAVTASTEYKFSLVILDSKDGHVLEIIPSPENLYLQYPVWIAKENVIAVIASGDKGKSILIYDLNNGKWNELVNTGFVNVDQLKSEGDYLFFNGGFTGIDEIYSICLTDKKIRKLTNSEFGAFYPDVSLKKNLLAYSSYGLKGYDVILKSFSPELEEEFIMPDSIMEQTYSNAILKVDTKIAQEEIQDAPLFKVKPYHKAMQLINIHSWAPYWFNYMDPNIDDPQISKGITILSQNELSTAFASFGYERKDGLNYLHTGFTYKGLYPVFDFSTTYGGKPAVALITDTSLNKLNPNLYYSLSAYVPLRFSTGKIISGVQPFLQYTYSSTYYFHSLEKKYLRGVEFFEPRIYLYSYLRTSIRDIQPRFGFTLDTKITTAPFESELYGNIRSARLNIYLPGLFKNQGLRLKYELQNQKVDAYYFPNHLSLPRGYVQRNFIKMNKYSAEYAFPVLYPDFSAGALLYLKRIRGNLFVDYMKGVEKYISATTTSKPVYPLSQGLELYADYHIFRFIFELSSGVRLAYFPHENSYGAQILFTVNLDQF